ncbi:MAG: hypothetical protein WBB67_06495 [bacterium]
MKKVARIVVWIIVALLILLVLYPIFRQKYILYRIQNDPRLKEFERCILRRYEFTHIDEDPHKLMDLYLEKYSGVIFSFEDTLSAHGIRYYYTINIQLEDNKIVQVMLGSTIQLNKDQTVKSIISDLERDSGLVQLIACTDIKKCHHNYQVFLFVGDKDTVKYDKTFGITYAKLSSTPGELSALPYYSTFQNMIRNKGFTNTDFDSLRYIKYSDIYNGVSYDTWRMQAYCSQCSFDIVEVGNYAVSQAHLKWLSRPDTINPGFLKTKVFNKLLATGLTKDYINKKMFLEETGATRLADYYKRGDKIIEASRIVGYFKYRWRTDSWIDKLHGGLKLKIYFTYFMNRRDLETVRIGLSPSDFHDRITLHPLDDIIDYDVITRISSEIDTTDLSFRIRQNGNIVITFVYDKHTYEIDVETGNIKKERYWGVGMSCCPPYDRHLYGQMEGQVSKKRSKKP